jgi:hypothetical protein
MIPTVAHTAEFQRVAELPRRRWSAEDLEALTSELTDILKTPGGTMSLRPVQALALHDAGVEGGLFGPIGVGEGKTLITLLLAIVLGARRPLLLLPASLIEKTQRERLALSRHWRVSTALRCFSYEMLGRVQSADELETYRPDAIICDEVHRLKNKRAAVTRRVARYMHDHVETKFCGLSGSVMDRSLTEFAHILRWALKFGAPIPQTNEELDEWAEALDNGIDPMARRKAGALLEFRVPEDAGTDEVVAARRGFRRRLTETPGVVATVGEGEHVDCSIYLRGIRHHVAPVTEANFVKLRTEWRTPDDWELMTAVDIWRHAQELAIGLFYVWDPRPPEEWRQARSAWNRYVREVISRSRTWDSELHVANAIDAGELPAGRPILAKWRELRPTFMPHVKPIWHDDSALQVCADWMRTPGLVWTEHGFFAQELSKRTGLPYYGAGGLDAKGRYIEDAKPGTSAICSIDANREGKNLQKLWHRNLLVCPPSSASWCEQVIARTHRPGQEADEVIVDVLLGCRENFDAIIKAIESARAVQDTTGKKQKLLLADITLPTESEIDALRSARWIR